MIEIIEEIKRIEQARIGDIFDACKKRGCEETFLKAFESRIMHYPEEQTKIFLEGTAEKLLPQWKIYLEVMVEKRPNHPNKGKWEKALSMLD